MADNIELNAGSGGATLATDDAGAGGHVQIVKLAISTDGSATPIPADATNGILADVKRVQGTVTVDGSGVTQPISASSLPLPTGAATSANQTTMIGHLDGVEGLLTTIDGDTGTLAGAVSGTEMQVDVVAALPAGDNNIGNVDIASALPAGDNNIGNVDLASAIPAGTNNIGDVDVLTIAAGSNAIGNVGLIGRASGGMSIFRSIDIDETEEEIKSSAGQVFSISAFNTTNAPLYLKFYNATAANVTVGTTTPVLTFVVPGNADSDGAGFVWNNDIGFAFGTAITVACTGAVADNDTTAPSANACIINIGYA